MAQIQNVTLKNILESLDDARKYHSLQDLLRNIPAVDLAAVFEELPKEKMPILFRLCQKDQAAELFAELSAPTQKNLIDGLGDTELKDVIEALFADDAADLVGEMPADVVQRILAQAEPETRRMINELLKYPEDSAGGIMTTEFMELRPDMNTQQALAAIRESGIDKATIDNCYVTTPDHKLLGVVSLRALVLEKEQDKLLAQIMETPVISVQTQEDQEDVSRLFEKYGVRLCPLWTAGENWWVLSPWTMPSASCVPKTARIWPL